MRRIYDYTDSKYNDTKNKTAYKYITSGPFCLKFCKLACIAHTGGNAGDGDHQCLFQLRIWIVTLRA